MHLTFLPLPNLRQHAANTLRKNPVATVGQNWHKVACRCAGPRTLSVADNFLAFSSSACETQEIFLYRTFAFLR